MFNKQFVFHVWNAYFIIEYLFHNFNLLFCHHLPHLMLANMCHRFLSFNKLFLLLSKHFYFLYSYNIFNNIAPLFRYLNLHCKSMVYLPIFSWILLRDNNITQFELRLVNSTEWRSLTNKWNISRPELFLTLKSKVFNYLCE